MPAQRIDEHRLVVGIDYGTTYTGIAYATPDSGELPLDEIDLVENWGPNMGNHKKVPSVISFSRPTRAKEQQWGSDLSKDAVAMIHTKLQLDLQDVAGELDLIVHALKGMKDLNFGQLKLMGPLPAYTPKSAEDIVKAYLTKVFEYLSEAIEGFSKELTAQIPVDIVVTVPTEWSYRAKNSTYRALTNAGFNSESFPELTNVIFVTEPEAAAMYTARYLKEDKGEVFLKPRECFILCDAGGGTVDVVSYNVKQVKPTLELERVGIPTGDKCGAIFIDFAFKKWLRAYIGDKYYKQLDENLDMNLEKISSHTTEGESMRELMRRFDPLKKQFHQKHRDMHLDLPKPLDNLNLEGKVNGGEIIITNEIMTEFFRECVKKIMDLLEMHMFQIDNMGKRTKNVFLVGGFGESPFLQEEIRLCLELRGIKLRIPDTSWTAVVRGAVICGIEKATIGNLSIAGAFPQHYGVSVSEPYSKIHHDTKDIGTHPATGAQVAQGQLLWLINKGDLILLDQPHTFSQVIMVSFKETDSKKRKLTIYSYPEEDDRPNKLANSKHELKTSHILEYDLSPIPLKSLEKSKAKDGTYYTVRIKLSLTATSAGLESVLTWGTTELATGSELWS